MKAPEFFYQEPFPLSEDKTEYYLLSKDYISLVSFEGTPILKIDLAGIEMLAQVAMHDVAFMLRTEHIQQIAQILSDPQSSENDRFVALSMLKNAEISARGILPFCQDTGTATIIGKKGQNVWTGQGDAEALSRGVYKVYTEENLRYSQTIPLDMFTEKNSGTNLPAQIDLYSVDGDEYQFLFIAKGGGSANKTTLYQETKALLTPEKLLVFLVDKLKSLGTSACPPYHVVFVIGGTSAEANLKAVKLASAKYLDNLPETGNDGGRAFRDRGLEQQVLEASYNLGIGAQFGGKHFALDIRIIRMPRHGASCPVGMGVSCVADRNIKAKINKDGLWIEKLEDNPGRFIPAEYRQKVDIVGAVEINLDKPMKEILSEISKYPIGTRLSLSGTIIVGRDIAHAKLKERIESGLGLPQYIKDHPIYYAGPAKKPQVLPSGSFGPTTAGRMDPYVELFQKHGGSMVMIAKGNRSQTEIGRAHV